jgi:serine/threonine protein kinase
MAEPAPAPGLVERLLARFVLEGDRRQGPEALADRAKRYPSLARELEQLLALSQELSWPRRLGGYCMVRLIARGGMGEIYEAVQDRPPRHVAVKVIRRGPDARARFRWEQRVLDRLRKTPNVLPFHKAGEVGPVGYFVMPYIEGMALDDVIRWLRRPPVRPAGHEVPALADLVGEVMVAGGPAGAAAAGSGLDALSGDRSEALAPTLLDRGLFRDWVPQAPPAAAVAPRVFAARYFQSVALVIAKVAETLEYIHRDGIVHNDVKPSNIMLERCGTPWLIDFGLAAVAERRGSGGGRPQRPGPDRVPFATSGVVGTPPYMAPEQFDGRVDARTDVWGLGVTLYELFTLRRPFGGQDQGELREQIRGAAPALPRQWVADLPPDLQAICLKALQKDPARRYQSAGELAEALTRWLGDRPTRARPLNPAQRLGLAIWGHHLRPLVGWLARRVCGQRRGGGCSALAAAGGAS